MPIYEYRCNDCNAEFEKLVFGQSPVVTCEKCGSEKTEKRMSRFGTGRSSGSATSGSSGGSRCGGCSSSSCAGCS